jgi:hypothetical protein
MLQRLQHTALLSLVLLVSGIILAVGCYRLLAGPPAYAARHSAPAAVSSLVSASATLTGTVTLPARMDLAPMGNMSIERRFFSTTLLADGRVLVAGGDAQDQALLKTTEIYDPATGTFTPTGNLIHGRSHHDAVLLPDGRVLIIEGITSNTGLPRQTAEIYDPATGTFNLTAYNPDTGAYYLEGLRNYATTGATTLLLPEGIVPGPSSMSYYFRVRAHDMALAVRTSRDRASLELTFVVR